jgi:N-acyl-phosphatidylethanolamine-hydrolysing phospholipase D
VHWQATRSAPGFDLALLSIGGFHNDGVHCEPEECAALGRDIGARVLVPLHWGTIYLAEGPPHELPARFVRGALAAGTAPEDVWVMRIGETRALPPPARSRVPGAMAVLDRPH